MAAAFLICLCAVFCLKSTDVQAATKMATESYGKYMYYPVQGTIYRMDTTTGKTKKIKSISKTNWVRDISYYKGYLYFTVDYYYYTTGTDGSKTYVCRMKTNGSGFKKLGCGSSAKIYNGKIYYVRGEIKKENYAPITQCKGIARMNLDGKSKKTLISGNRYYDPMIVNNRIYYRHNPSSSVYLYSANISGGDRKCLASDVRELLSDGSNIYYTIAKEMHKISGSSGEDTYLFQLAYRKSGWGSYISNLSIPLAVKDGAVYYFNMYNGSYQLKKYTESTNTIKTLKSIDGILSDVYIGKGNYMIIRRSISGSNKYSEAVGRIKTDGKSYTTLKKYFRP